MCEVCQIFYGDLQYNFYMRDFLRDLATLRKSIHHFSRCVASRQSLKGRLITLTILIIMEVASPLTFTPGQAGTKRAFPCSPGLVESTNVASVGMDITEDSYAQQSFKRRRFNDHADTTQQTTPHAANPFAMVASNAPSFANGAFFSSSWADPVVCDILLMSLGRAPANQIVSFSIFISGDRAFCRSRVASEEEASGFEPRSLLRDACIGYDMLQRSFVFTTRRVNVN